MRWQSLACLLLVLLFAGPSHSVCVKKCGGTTTGAATRKCEYAVYSGSTPSHAMTSTLAISPIVWTELRDVNGSWTPDASDSEVCFNSADDYDIGLVAEDSLVMIRLEALGYCSAGTCDPNTNWITYHLGVTASPPVANGDEEGVSHEATVSNVLADNAATPVNQNQSAYKRESLTFSPSPTPLLDGECIAILAKTQSNATTKYSPTPILVIEEFGDNCY